MTTLVPPTPVPSVLVGRPRYEGANIRTWIGFKHFMYLVEEAVLQWLRDQGCGARELFHQYGLGTEIVDCSVQLPAVLEVDDEVRAEVVAGTGNRLRVQMSVHRDGQDVVVLRGHVTVALIPETDAPTHRPAPDTLAAWEAAELGAATGLRSERALPAGADLASTLAPAGSGAFLWSWRAPYFYCHFSDRVQHSGYVRALEEVVDRFLADRGISVGRMLRERAWIPVVSRARVRLAEPAHMEETVHTVFHVDDVLREMMFSGRMDCWVQRDDRLILVASATILHGYAISRGPDAGQLARLDPEVCAILTGSPS
ncbi:thioesterase family protein [Micromonospora fiedleri]|uniref:Thioesterase family protein n=1 Tax=Micromonospora fiedleri TaxID=1157498 RepID=A0ABS1UTZ5_9ACTN|nr:MULTISPECIES: thioesterase family protein [Micromonospora]MBL6279793.1 thioesterase family protein [Micromonospora fiedleri]WSK43714.1 thioesterase family protein [Micromonospora maris]